MDGLGKEINLEEIEKFRLKYGKTQIKILNFTPDGKKIISGSVGTDGKITIWDRKTGELDQSLILGNVASIALFPDLNRVAFAENEGILDSPDLEEGHENGTKKWKSLVKIIELSSGQILHVIEGRERIIKVKISPDGNYLLTASSNKIRIYELASYSLMQTIKLSRPLKRIVGMDYFLTVTNKFLITAHGRLYSEGTVNIWELETGSILNTFEEKGLTYLEPSLNGNELFIMTEEGLNLRRVPSGEILKNFGRPPGAILAKYFIKKTPDNKGLIFDLEGGEGINVFDFASGNQLGVLWTRGRFTMITFSPDGKNLVGGVMDYDNISYLKGWDYEQIRGVIWGSRTNGLM